MKIALPVLAMSIVALTAQADPPAAGGFKGPDGTALVTAAQANEMKDDSFVKL